jgi:hypothetical protein
LSILIFYLESYGYSKILKSHDFLKRAMGLQNNGPLEKKIIPLLQIHLLHLVANAKNPLAHVFN